MAIDDAVLHARERLAYAQFVQVRKERPPRSASREEKDAWFVRFTAAQKAHSDAVAATGYGPGRSTYVP